MLRSRTSESYSLTYPIQQCPPNLFLSSLVADKFKLDSASDWLDKSNGDSSQGHPTFCHLLAFNWYGLLEQCESQLLICQAIFQCVLWLFAHSILQTSNHCIPSSAQCSSLTLNYPHSHPTLNLLPRMVENKQHTRWMAFLEHPRGHWIGCLPTHFKKDYFWI